MFLQSLVENLCIFIFVFRILSDLMLEPHSIIIQRIGLKRFVVFVWGCYCNVSSNGFTLLWHLMARKRSVKERKVQRVLGGNPSWSDCGTGRLLRHPFAIPRITYTSWASTLYTVVCRSFGICVIYHSLCRVSVWVCVIFLRFSFAHTVRFYTHTFVTSVCTDVSSQTITKLTDAFEIF